MSLPELAALHLVIASLKPDAEPAAVDAAVEQARAMAAVDGVERSVVARSPATFVVATWLPRAAALEPFAASPEHMTFIMRGLAPVVASVRSASITLDVAAPAESAPPAAVWAFALPEAPTLYQWQVRDLLADVAGLPGAASAGVTFEERERYRAAGIVLLAAADRETFEAGLAETRARWADLPPLEEALADVV